MGNAKPTIQSISAQSLSPSEPPKIINPLSPFLRGMSDRAGGSTFDQVADEPI
jgi:hypothetical protein